MDQKPGGGESTDLPTETIKTTETTETTEPEVQRPSDSPHTSRSHRQDVRRQAEQILQGLVGEKVVGKIVCASRELDKLSVSTKAELDRMSVTTRVALGQAKEQAKEQASAMHESMEAKKMEVNRQLQEDYEKVVAGVSAGVSALKEKMSNLIKKKEGSDGTDDQNTLPEKIASLEAALKKERDWSKRVYDELKATADSPSGVSALEAECDTLTGLLEETVAALVGEKQRSAAAEAQVESLKAELEVLQIAK